jgi:hypothetical protein
MARLMTLLLILMIGGTGFLLSKMDMCEPRFHIIKEMLRGIGSSIRREVRGLFKMITPTCPHCGKKLNDFFCGNYKGAFFYKNLKSIRPRYFCTKECYEDYEKDFVVEVYNGKPIYCVEVDGEKRYKPYLEAGYYYTTIDDCKERMDAKVAVVDIDMFNLCFL